MFSFHKPKIYRSNLGCCICKAKSSSSRFTDSKKYENEFERCFRIQEKRSGEICNACVLLVKRWKKLSAENRLIKHWHHVVDARAGPGTKLTSNRRLTGPSYHQLRGSSQSPESSQSSSAAQSQVSSSSSSGQQQKQRGNLNNSTTANNSSPPSVLPLSSSQATNQPPSSSNTSNTSNNKTSSSSRSGSSLSNKARAIDTNVSTFTFGLEPRARNYMSIAESSGTSTGSNYFYSNCSSSASALAPTKPQSALNSSAFESVIKRFRQRQQQQKLQAQRRQHRQQQLLLLQQQVVQTTPPTKRVLGAQQKSSQLALSQLEGVEENESSSSSSSLSMSCNQHVNQVLPATKRIKRCSESTTIGALTIDGHRVSSLLDQNVWRKEKICCGVIFRGLHNEVAVFPKLLKPCSCRVEAKLKQLNYTPAADDNKQQQQLLLPAPDSPPPRTEKSGSISSCDSNTSGTGSMEQASSTDGEQPQLQQQQQPQQQQQQQWNDDDNESSQWNTHQFYLSICSTK